MTTAPKKEKKGFFSGILEFWAMHSLVISIIFIILAILFPILFNKQYLITVAINCLMFATLSLSLNLITGYMGITSLGHAAFFGVGAYTAAILEFCSDGNTWNNSGFYIRRNAWYTYSSYKGKIFGNSYTWLL